MNKSIIVYGPSGCGKTRYAERMRKHFGLDRVVDGWDGTRMLYERRAQEPFGVLYLTSDMGLVAREREVGMTPLSFAEVAKQINDAIPLTDWEKCQPPSIGEWDTETETFIRRRYWNGKCWSKPFYAESDQQLKNHNAEFPSVHQNNEIKWRGLAEEPIIFGRASK